MARCARRWRAGSGISVLVILIMLSACSMQKPASSFETGKDSGESGRDAVAAARAVRETEPLRIDYLMSVKDIVSPEIYIYKEKRRLYVIQSNVLVRDYPVGLGSQPLGDKERAEDGRTPEGDFLVCRKNPAGRFSKALALNYPGRRHAEKALFAGVLSPLDFKEILAAYERRTIPPANTPLGGGFYIHAGGAQRDWTDGCIALYNSDMEELFQITYPGTPVHIRP